MCRPRQLGYDAAEDFVDVLRKNHETCQLTVHQNGGRRLVARRLDAEDDVSHDAWESPRRRSVTDRDGAGRDARGRDHR